MFTIELASVCSDFMDGTEVLKILAFSSVKSASNTSIKIKNSHKPEYQMSTF